MTGPDLSVVIPVYRSADPLPLLVERLLRVLKAAAKNFEIVFVEDGSGDDSWEVLTRLQRSHPDCVYLVQYLVSNISVPGYASIIIAVFVLGGLQLLSLGVMGEYLGRLHLNVNRKPQYTVRRVLGQRARRDRGRRRAASGDPPAVYNAGTEKCEAGPP